MKDILVAIDFSKGSVHALEYAIDLANVAQNNVIMVWVDNQGIQDINISSDSAEIRDESKKNLEELVRDYKGKLKPGKLTYKIRKGRVYQEIAAQARQSDCGLLITGAHGVSGFEEFWIGSNAARIVAYAPCPVITIKFHYDISRGIRRILLPVVGTPQTIQKAQFTAILAKMHGADLSLVGIYTSRLKTLQKVVDNNILKIEKYFASQGLNYITDTITTDNLATGIIAKGEDSDVDMIAIMTDWQNEAATTILGQFSQQLINYSPVPVLSVPPKENFIL